nr:hypothetical protein [Saccharopolyspora pogona]
MAQQTALQAGAVTVVKYTGLPATADSTLSFDPARFQTKPPACYRASW